MTANAFVHLHVHTHYSLLDGATRIEDLVARAKQFQMPAVAVTDHGNLFGAIEFYRKAMAAGVKPIIGCEMYLAPVDRRIKGSAASNAGGAPAVTSGPLNGKPSNGDSSNGGPSHTHAGGASRDGSRSTSEPMFAPAFEMDASPSFGTPGMGAGGSLRRSRRRLDVEPTERGEGKDAYHLLLLAMNLEGYRNLLRLVSIGYTEGFYRKPRIDKEILRELSAGLLCTSTCIGGEVPQALLTKDRAAAEEMAKTYLSIFGPDRFFIEMQDHGIPEQRMLNPELADIARRLGVATIATNDVHYLEHGDVEAHDVLCCINTGSLVSEEDRFKFPTDQFYFKNAEEMAALFPDHAEALANTLRVADLCNVELDLTKRYAPVYKVPASVTGPDHASLSDAEYLRRLVYQGATERYGEIAPELKERIDYELDVITGKGFASYFLIVWDCVTFGRQHGIPLGARGSGCSSVVAYCLRISHPDPIRYGLYFERFMDPDRDEMPDIDLDICQNGRQQIIDYVREKYGHVAQIITFNTLKARAAVKDVARVMGLGFEESTNLTKLIPGELNMTLEKALEREPELKKRYVGEPQVRRIIDISRRLEGLARNAGVHAAGVVVADQPLVNFLPLYKSAGQEGLVTQFDGPTVEKVGLLKMDFLGLRTLTVLERARQLAEHGSGRPIDLDRLDLTDLRVYELFARGDTKGVFQFESGGMRDVVMRMKPNRIEDLIAANALYRPGPMEYIPEYIARKHGTAWTTPHPTMTEVLRETYGIMVYQEQVSRMVNRLGGIELKAAFRLAKAISKKNKAMIEAMRGPFLDGCEKNGVKRDVADNIFEDILKFGGYAFNKAHSTGYALVAFQTAWMKTYFPVEFMAALMTFELSDTDKIAEYREECREMTISIEPPSINTSVFDFVVERTASTEPVGPTFQSVNASTISRGSIRFGLGAIKGVGAKAVTAIVDERARAGAFGSLFDFCERIDPSIVNKGALEAMICAGAFDCTGAMRKAMLDAAERAMSAGQSLQKDRRVGQMGLFGMGSQEATDTLATARLTTAEWSEAEMLAREKAALGFYITKHPLTSRERLLEACVTASTADLADAKNFPAEMKVTLGGMVSSLRMLTPRTGRNSGKLMGILTLEDLSGRIEAILFSDDLNKYRHLLAPDQIVFVEGAVDRKREEPSLRVSRVIAEENAARELARILLLDIHEDSAIDAVAAALRTHKGTCPVYLNVATNDGAVVQIECNVALRASCTPELISELTSLLGGGAVSLLGANKKKIPLRAETTRVLLETAR